MQNAELSAEPRSVLGKRVRYLRRAGIIPANLYARGAASVALQVPAKEAERLLAAVEGTALVKLKVNGDERMALMKMAQFDPVRGTLLHIDFQQVAMTEKVRASIALHFTGEAPAAKTLDGTLLRNIETLEVQALPGDLPSHLEVDVSSLEDFDVAIHVGDIPHSANVEILTPPEELVAKVTPPRIRVEEEEAEEAVAPEAAEAEVEAEAEAPEAEGEEAKESED